VGNRNPHASEKRAVGRTAGAAAENYLFPPHNEEGRKIPAAEGETIMPKIALVSAANSEPNPALANPTVAHCMSAWEHAYKTTLAKDKDSPLASYEASKAYREAMPPLSGYENIRDFIACTAHAMLIGALLGEQGTKLLYAAQVALCTVRSQPAPPKPAKA
jgi:hypothetical protein